MHRIARLLVMATFAAPAGTRGSAEAGGAALLLGNRRAVALAPALGDLGATDDGPEVAAALDGSVCPPIALTSSGALEGAEATLADFRSVGAHGIVSVSTHGDALFRDLPATAQSGIYGWRHTGSQEVLLSG